MRTKLSAFAAAVVESGWLIALVVVPVFFNPYSSRIFEEDKVPLLRSIAVVMAVGLVVWMVEEGRAALRPGGVSVWRLPLVRPAVVLSAVYVAATVTSVAPAQSLWGAYIRLQGTYTWLCYMVVFAALILLVRQPQQLERIVTVILLASVPAAAYSVVQHFGYDPVPWAGDVVDRVHSTAGNPIFISGYMIMVVPLTLARLITQIGDGARRAGAVSDHMPGADAIRAPSSHTLLVAAYAVLLALQLLTIVYSQSRGPFVGLCAGLTFFGIVFAVHRRLRWLTLATAAVVGAGLLFLVVFNMRDSPLAPLRKVPYVGRLGSILDTEDASNRVRSVIWKGATDLLAAQPSRALFGYGPETLFLVYWQFFPPELSQYEVHGTAPDRSHNETFDGLIMLGIAGCVAQLAVFLAFFLHTLQWLGMIATITERRIFLATALLGAGLGAWLPYVIDGSFRFSGVGLPAGCAAGIAAYLTGRALIGLGDAAERATASDLLLIGLLAAVMAHFVEIHFGIAVVATRLYFWAYAAVAVVVGVPLVRSWATAPVVASAEGVSTVERDAPVLSGGLVTVSPIVGIILILLTFGLYRRGIDLAANGPIVASVLASVWIVGALLIAAEPGGPKDWWLRLVGYVTTTLGIWILFVAIHKPWADWTPQVRELTPAIVQELGQHRSHTISILYLFVAVILAFTAAVSMLREPSGATRVARGAGWSVLYLVLVAVALYAVVVTNVQPSRADIYSKQGEFYEQQRRWDGARVAYSDAMRVQPHEQYAISLGRVLMQHARADLVQKPVEREQAMEEARRILEDLRQQYPLNPDHPRNLAKLHRYWITLSTESAEQSQHLAQAEAYYEQTVAMNPNSAGVLNEWATLYLDRGDGERALELLDRSSGLDQRYATTSWLRAQALAALGRREEALAAYDRALDRNPGMLPAWSGKAMLLTQLGRIPEAIVANQKALRVVPNDLISHRNLAILFRQTGQNEQAIREANAALAVAPPPERPALERFIAELQNEVGRRQ